MSAYDPQPPSRAAALRHLASLVTQRDPEALQIQEKLLQVPASCCGPCPLPWSLSSAVSPVSRAGAECAIRLEMVTIIGALWPCWPSSRSLLMALSFLPSRCFWRMCSTRMPLSTSQPSKVSRTCWGKCQHFVRECFVLWGLWALGAKSRRALHCQGHGQAEGLASPALPGCGFVLFNPAWGHMWAPCQVPEAGDCISQLFLLPGAGHHPCACTTGWGCSSSTAWSQPQHPGLTPTDGSVQLRLAEERDQGDPQVLPLGFAKVATPEYSHSFPGNPQVSACSSTLSTALRALGCPWALQAGASTLGDACDDGWSQSPEFCGREVPFPWPTVMLALLLLGW